MWELENRTRFAAERTFLRDRDGAEVLIVVVRSTFSIGQAGDLRVADVQTPVVTVPIHVGEPERTSLISDSDFVLLKPATDILLVGQARPLDGKPSIAVEVKARVGEWQKRLVVFGDRRWEHGLSGWSLSDPEPFSSLPLVYERAFGGGACDENPVGVGFTPPTREGAERRAPNLEDRGISCDHRISVRVRWGSVRSRAPGRCGGVWRAPTTSAGAASDAPSCPRTSTTASGIPLRRISGRPSRVGKPSSSPGSVAAVSSDSTSPDSTSPSVLKWEVGGWTIRLPSIVWSSSPRTIA